MSTFVKITPSTPVAPPDAAPFGTLSIDLTIREAKALYALCQIIGGEPGRDGSARAVFDEIRNELVARGIYADIDTYINRSPRSASISFKEYGKINVRPEHARPGFGE